ncbi:hypothetical protein [Paenibacillus sp. GYB003]|uniref:hypothetical protein n=1 Tax=Paenibacillus sp. GYB003 TaxID=2994392 RepID=UPI002F967330
MRKPIQYEPAQYQEIPGILPPITIREFKGVNTFDAFSIPENMFTDMKNMCTDEYPTVTTRPGYTVLGSAIGTKVLGIGAHKDQTLVAVFNDGSMRKWDGSAWQTLTTGLNTTAEWSFTNFQGNLSDINLIGMNGMDPAKKFDGTSVSNLNGAPAGGNFVTTYQNRLWCAVKKELHASALDQPEQWTLFAGNDEDSYVKDMESTAGEDINMLSGGLTKLTIGMPSSLHELYGGVPSDFNTRLITEDEGLSNNKSAVTQEGVMRFMHRVGIFEYAGGVLPDKTFSEIVRRYIPDIANTSAAGSEGSRLYFFIPPGTILYYDPRPGIQAWSVWNDIPVSCFARMGHDLYIGTNDGRVLNLGGETDGGNAIQWKIVTKPFTNGSIAQKMRWYKLWIVVEMTSGSSLTVSLSRSADGDSDWQQVQSLSGSATIQKQRMIIPVNTIANEEYIRIKIEGSGYAKLYEITRQQRALPLY